MDVPNLVVDVPNLVVPNLVTNELYFLFAIKAAHAISFRYVVSSLPALRT
ncbi:MAG: hypothetical protein ACLFUF_06750 [Opitutales bacterium]